MRPTAIALSIALLAGCNSTMVKPGYDPDQPGHEPVKAISSNPIEALVNEGMAALKKGDHKEASIIFNAALKLDVTNADLHFLNALAYHLMGADGDATKYELAEQGFTRVLKFDPAHYPARYQLGLLYMDQRRYQLAQTMFASAALNQWNNPHVLYNLAAASYYARDPRTAEAALRRLGEVAPEMAREPRFLRAAAVSTAALDDAEAATGYLAAYRETVGENILAEELEHRLSSWDAFYRHDAKFLLAQANPFGSSSDSGYGGGYGGGYDSGSSYSSDPYGSSGYGSDPYGSDTGSGAGAATGSDDGSFVDNDMVVVDVVLIGTQEDVRNARGINLLNGLRLQYGDPLMGTPAYLKQKTRAWTKDDTKTWDTDALGVVTEDRDITKTFSPARTITESLSIAAVSYSLNIANSVDAHNEVLAKPSLVAQSGQTSEFFSGTEILAAAVSGGQGDSVSVQKEVGVKLAVTPEVLPNDMVRLHVLAERTFLTDPSTSVVFEFRMDTTKTNVNSTVTMRYGETLILGGLTERETSKSLDGVPVLRDIPLLNLLFSERVERQFQRSVLILLTPRRPHYTSRAPENRKNDMAQMSEFERDLERLAQRHRDWFVTRPTFNDILEKVQGREFFNEFQAGDIQTEAWYRSLDDNGHIAQVHRRLAAH